MREPSHRMTEQLAFSNDSSMQLFPPTRQIRLPRSVHRQQLSDSDCSHQPPCHTLTGNRFDVSACIADRQYAVSTQSTAMACEPAFADQIGLDESARHVAPAVTQNPLDQLSRPADFSTDNWVQRRGEMLTTC